VNVLIGCEESQTICKAFRERGHVAFSCDKLPTRGKPEWHLMCDIMSVLDMSWDLIILHPPCTALCVSGNRWYGEGQDKHESRIKAIEWTTCLWNCAVAVCDRVALENPVSVIFQHLEKTDLQYIQPWQFGHGEVKKTGFALNNLPRLKPTNIVEGREQRIWKMPPGTNRARDRSVTYQGVADAIADQWSTNK